MAVALLALFVALGGTATAARILIKSSTQIKAGVVKRSDIAANAVDSSRVNNGSLTLDDLDATSKGAIQAAGTQALEVFRNDGPEAVPAGTTAKVATLSNIPPGSYALFAKTVLTSTSQAGILSAGQSLGGHCVLNAEGTTDQSRVLLGTPGAASPGNLFLQFTRSFDRTAQAYLECDVTGGAWRASNTSIIALRVGVSPRQAVEGR